MVRIKRLLVGAMAGASVLATVGVASADCPDNQAVFVFDQSNSMNWEGPDGNPAWQSQRDIAVEKYKELLPGTEVAIMWLGNSTLRGTPAWGYEVTLSDGLLKGTDDATLLPMLDAAAQPNSSYNTPLAGAVCYAVDHMLLDPRMCLLESQRQIYLFTDGEENSTPTGDQCYSTISSSTPFDIGGVNLGFGLEDGSWERKVANKVYTGSADLTQKPHENAPDIVLSVAVVFNYQTSQSVAGDVDAGPAGGALQALGTNTLAFYEGFAQATGGSYYEAKRLPSGNPAVIPVAGDTDPMETRSCVDGADIDRILTAYGLPVEENSSSGISFEDLAKRDVNNDMIVDTFDYYVVLANYGTCRTTT